MIEARTPADLDAAFDTFKGELVQVTIPSWETLSPTEQAEVRAGARWPITLVSEGGLAALDLLVERSLEAWTKANE